MPSPLQKVLTNKANDDLQASEMSGVLLFCDLTGFSRLGAEAVRKSERGPEELRAQIDVVFGCVAQEVETNGGGILYFAGDAVAAFWQDGTQSNVARAIACGLAIQAAVPKLRADAPLKMKAGVTAGALWTLDVQGPDARIPVVLGDALAQVDDMALAEKGVRLSPSAAELFGDAHRSDLIVLEPPEVQCARDLKTDADFDPTPWLRRHERAGLELGDAWQAEFRQTHVLFARLAHDDVVDGASAREVSQRIKSCAQAIERERGTLLQVCRDDKGLVLVAAWGLAQSVVENGAERATITAGDVAGHGAVVSVATGKVFYGVIGAGSYRQFVVVGDVINRAAALSGLNKAPVMIDTATRQAVDRRFDVNEIGRVTLKGQTAETAIFGVGAERLRGLSHTSDLIGRGPEIERLKNCAVEAKQGISRLLSIIGEAGLGKSRLAVWFERYLRDSDQPVYEIHADRLRRTVGYWPLKGLIAEVFGADLSDEPSATQRRLQALLPNQPEAFLPLLTPVLPIELQETESTVALTGAGRAERRRELVAALLVAGLPRHATLIVEDAHWLDSATWQVLDALASAGNLSICIVARPLDPLDLPTEAKRFLDEETVETLHLGPLSAQEAGVLAARVLDARSAADPLAALLYREATGHPLFTGALALALASRGMIRAADGVAHLVLGEDSLDGLIIPSDAAGAVQEQIAALTGAQQILLKTASVIGREFSEPDLASLMQQQTGHAPGADLFAIAETGLIERMPGAAWRFHHAIVADAAYTSLTTDQAEGLHARVAEMIAARLEQIPDQTDHALLAHHYERAGQKEAALTHLKAAAQAAQEAYANLEVINFLTRALRLSEGGEAPRTIGQWRYDIAYALRALGQYQRAEDFLKRCISGLDQPPPETGGQAARGLIGGYTTFRLRPHNPPKPKAERDPIILTADATMMLSEIHYELNKIPFALAEILRGANLARNAGGDSATLAKLYIGLALISTSLPWALNGDALQKEALGMVDRLDDPATESWVYMVSGNYESGKAGWSEGEGYFQHSMSVAGRCGERKTWETSASTLANLKRLEGRFEEAKGWSDITLEHSRDRGIMQGIIWSHNGRARDLLCLSAWDELREDVAALEKFLSDTTNASDANDNNKLVYFYTEAALRFADGDHDAFMHAFDAALNIVKRTKRPQVYMTQNASFYSDLTWAMREAGHDPAAVLERQKLITAAAKRAGRQYRSGMPMAELCAGDLFWMRGKAKQAQARWRASAEAAVARGMFYNAAQALDRLTRTGLEDQSAARDAHLQSLGIALPKLWRLSDAV
ncbi:MAG: AAA family ATPase [Pseudomonadota bacterium]